MERKYTFSIFEKDKEAAHSDGNSDNDIQTDKNVGKKKKNILNSSIDNNSQT